MQQTESPRGSLPSARTASPSKPDALGMVDREAGDWRPADADLSQGPVLLEGMNNGDPYKADAGARLRCRQVRFLLVSRLPWEQKNAFQGIDQVRILGPGARAGILPALLRKRDDRGLEGIEASR